MTRIFSTTRVLRVQAASSASACAGSNTAVIEGAAADHAADAVRLIRFERFEIVVGGDAARRDDRRGERPRERACRRGGDALQRTVTGNVGVDNCRGRLHPRNDAPDPTRRCRPSRPSLPHATRPSRASIPTAIRPGKARHAVRTRSGSRTATVPRITRCTPFPSQASMVTMSPNAPTELHREIDRVENCAHRVGVDRLAGKGAVEIDNVEPGEARRHECPCLRWGVVRKDRRPRHVSLHEAHTGAVLEIDRGKEDHGAASGGRSVRSLQ